MVSDLGHSGGSRNFADPLEVKLAGEVQELLLPKGSPFCRWCCMAARSRMANVLGGDFYDFIELDDGGQVLLVGDVTGHGLHASVVMALVYGFIHRAVRDVCNPHEVVSALNRCLRTFARRSEKLDHFFSATLFLGIIDPQSKSMSYVNAGHPAGLVKRNGELLKLPATSHTIGCCFTLTASLTAVTLKVKCSVLNDLTKPFAGLRVIIWHSWTVFLPRFAIT
jgi:serine phosphatase RsbU (regulator of sigma subunit)